MPEKLFLNRSLHTTLTLATSLVWLLNGLFCKVMDMVPRHRAIVARVLGEDISHFATKAIGGSEILICIWILTGIKPQWCALFQIMIVATMNTIEFFVAPDLLLYGRANAIVATFFCCGVFFNEFVNRKPGRQP